MLSKRVLSHRPLARKFTPFSRGLPAQVSQHYSQLNNTSLPLSMRVASVVFCCNGAATQAPPSEMELPGIIRQTTLAVTVYFILRERSSFVSVLFADIKFHMTCASVSSSLFPNREIRSKCHCQSVTVNLRDRSKLSIAVKYCNELKTGAMQCDGR